MPKSQEPIVWLVQISSLQRCYAAPYSCFIWDPSHLKNVILLVYTMRLFYCVYLLCYLMPPRVFKVAWSISKRAVSTINIYNLNQTWCSKGKNINHKMLECQQWNLPLHGKTNCMGSYSFVLVWLLGVPWAAGGLLVTLHWGRWWQSTSGRVAETQTRRWTGGRDDALWQKMHQWGEAQSWE